MYNPGWRNHPNFSWRDSNQAQSSGGQWRSEQQVQPSKAYSAPHYNAHPQRNSLENTLHAFMEEQSKLNRQMMEEIKEMKCHFLKLTESLAILEKENFLPNLNSTCKANTWPNPQITMI